jgi:hypothetical protein
MGKREAGKVDDICSVVASGKAVEAFCGCLNFDL